MQEASVGLAPFKCASCSVGRCRKIAQRVFELSVALPLLLTIARGDVETWPAAQGQDGKQRTLLRTFSNSFKKGTANLRRGLTPRSRTSSQTDELGEAVPPAPVPTAASAPPKVLDNQVEHQVHVKIAEVRTRATHSNP